ncbi:unnamed protein product [Cunninghamella blakesleeana]
MMRQGGRQTGPKGVIDDQRYQQKLEAYKKNQRIQEHNAKILSKAPITTTYLEDLKLQQQQLSANELILEAPKKNKNKNIHDDQDGDDDIDDLLNELEDDDDAIKQYREKRLKELKKLSNHKTRKQHKLFGTLEEVHPDDYVLSIDKEWKTVPVIVHLYDNTLDHCKQLDQILNGLAQKYCLAKFIRVSALALEFDLVGSPAILAYKSGILMANLVRLDDEVNSIYTPESIEEVLITYEVLSVDDQYDIPEKEIDSNSDFDD